VTFFRQPTTHGIGSGILSPDCTKFIVSIPKNASSYILDWSTKNSWSSATVGDECDWHLVQEVIVFLRDPIQRWLSGISQYISGHVLNVSNAYTSETGPGLDDQFMSAEEFIKGYNPIVERLLFDNLTRFDDHVWPQCEFFQDLLPHIPRKYFYIDQNFDSNVGDYLEFTPMSGLDRNHSDTNLDTGKIQHFICARLNTRPELQQRVHRAYAQDYKIIKQVFNQ